MIPSPRSLRRTASLLLLLLTLATGCDMSYVYHYHGTVYEADGRTPARGVGVTVGWEPDPALYARDNPHPAVSDARGEYRGSCSAQQFCSPWPLESHPAPLLTRDFWVFLKRGDSIQLRNVRLDPQQQATVGRGTRTLDLPPLTLDPAAHSAF